MRIATIEKNQPQKESAQDVENLVNCAICPTMRLLCIHWHVAFCGQLAHRAPTRCAAARMRRSMPCQSASGFEFFACCVAGAQTNFAALSIASIAAFVFIVGARFYHIPRLRSWQGLVILAFLHGAANGDALLLGALALLFFGGAFFYGKFKIKRALHALWQPQKSGNDALLSPELLRQNLTELKEFVRLAELRISELRADLNSFESKCYFIITGAVVIPAFFLTEGWCFDGVEFLRGVAVLLCLTAGILSGLMLIGNKFGLAGEEPQKLQDSAHWVKATLATLENSINSETRDEASTRMHLFLSLARYNKAIRQSNANIQDKENKFSLMAFFLFTGIIASVLWVLVRLLQHYGIASL